MGPTFSDAPSLSIRPGITAVGRVTFSSGDSSFKSLVIREVRGATAESKADFGWGAYN